MEIQELKELLKELYNHYFKINNKEIRNFQITYSLKLNYDSFNSTKFFEYLYEFIKTEIANIYNIPKSYLDKVKIRFVDYLPSIFNNTITLGVYQSIKNKYGKLYEALIYIPKWLFNYPKKLIETIAHELTHYIQDLKGKAKKSSYEYENFYQYYTSQEEIEARRVEKIVEKRFYNLINLISNKLYGNSRMYFL